MCKSLGHHPQRAKITKNMKEKERVKMGIPGLDDKIGGGIPKNNLVLVTGQTGSGKTLMGLQYLVKGAQDYGEKCMFITFEMSRDEIIYMGETFGWDLKALQKEGNVEILEFKLTQEHPVEIVRTIRDRLSKFKPDRVVFDSISTYGVYAQTIGYLEMMSDLSLEDKGLTSILTPEVALRRAIMELIDLLKSVDTTPLVISELPEESKFLSRDTISEFLADGVIVMLYTPIGGEEFGNLQIRKMRHTNHEHAIYMTKIGKDGLSIEEESAGILR